MKIADQPQAVVEIFQLAVHNLRNRLIANMGRTEDPILTNTYREQLDVFNFETIKEMELELVEPRVRTALIEQFDSIMIMSQQAYKLTSLAQETYVKRRKAA